jgi:hypothetical protein
MNLWHAPLDLQQTGRLIVRFLLASDEPAECSLAEASVHRSHRGRIWNATFTGATGQQVWKSTGLTNREGAMLLAQKWAKKARAERERLARNRKPMMRAQLGKPALTQKEVGLLLGMSERAVRAAEKRALQKLRQHPLLRQLWQDFLAGELDESWIELTPEEVRAVLGLVRTSEEWRVVLKILRWVQH